MKIQLIGNGGHAGNLRAAIYDQIVEESENKILAFGGLTCGALEARVTGKPEGQYPNVIAGTITKSSMPDAAMGVQVMAGAIIQDNVKLGDFCIINTGAIVEHGSIIGVGCHIAPGAIVLGDCLIGDFCFVGAGAVIVQGSRIPARTFIKAGTVWYNKAVGGSHVGETGSGGGA